MFRYRYNCRYVARHLHDADICIRARTYMMHTHTQQTTSRTTTTTAKINNKKTTQRQTDIHTYIIQTENIDGQKIRARKTIRWMDVRNRYKHRHAQKVYKDTYKTTLRHRDSDRRKRHVGKYIDADDDVRGHTTYTKTRVRKHILPYIRLHSRGNIETLTMWGGISSAPRGVLWPPPGV